MDKFIIIAGKYTRYFIIGILAYMTIVVIGEWLDKRYGFTTAIYNDPTLSAIINFLFNYK